MVINKNCKIVEAQDATFRRCEIKSVVPEKFLLYLIILTQTEIFPKF